MDRPSDGDLILMGRIGRAHGVRGQVRIKAYTADPMALGDYGMLTDAEGKRSFGIVTLQPAKDVVVATLKGVTNRTTAEALNGTDLYIRRDQLPVETDETEYYHADLVGLIAEALDGTELGQIIAVHDFGAGDLLEIAANGSQSGVLVPFTEDAVPTVDLDQGRVVVADFDLYAGGEAAGETGG